MSGSDDRPSPPPAHATLLASAGLWHDERHGSVVPPVTPSTTFSRLPSGALTDPRYLYIRPNNPTQRVAEEILMQLEGAADAALFASGMAGIAAATAFLKPGDGIVAQKGIYWAAAARFRSEAERLGLHLTEVSAGDAETALVPALQPGRTKLVWVETPANPGWELVDIASWAAAAHAAGAMLIVDNTVATPLLQKPLALGADGVFESATKYLNGHSDVLAGVLATADTGADWWQAALTARSLNGAILGAFESWLLIRGLRTLHLRVPAACRNAAALAERLAAHPAVARVLYPGLPDHPGHEIAAKQMQGGFGGMLSFCLHSEAAAAACVGAVRRIVRATSLGGTESLIEHRRAVEGPASTTPAELIRLSVGIEDLEDLWGDLNGALKEQGGR